MGEGEGMEKMQGMMNHYKMKIFCLYHTGSFHIVEVFIYRHTFPGVRVWTLGLSASVLAQPIDSFLGGWS